MPVPTTLLKGAWEPLRDPIRAVIDWAEQFGLKVTVTSVQRDRAKQQALRTNFERCVAAGKFPSSASLSPGMTCRFPANRVDDSSHTTPQALAWDSQVTDPLGRWTNAQLVPWWVAVRRAFGWEVPDNDVIHAQLPNWRAAVPQIFG